MNELEGLLDAAEGSGDEMASLALVKAQFLSQVPWGVFLYTIWNS